MGKVKLKLPTINNGVNCGRFSTNVRYAFPYFKANRGEYFHRVRSSQNHWGRDPLGYLHTSVSYWCGNSGFTTKGRMYSELPQGAVMCATCEGRAIGAGEDGLRVINGVEVKYSPRHKEAEKCEPH